MEQNERFELILRMLREYRKVNVTDLVDVLGVSGATIRSDIRELDDKGLLKKVYGGAVPVKAAEPEAAVLSVSFKAGNYFKNAQSKKALAERAFTYIDNNDTIMLDDSTTCAYLAQIISEHPEKKLTIATNSIYNAALLASSEHVRLYVGGGNVTASLPSVLDDIAAKTLSHYHVRKFFSGIHGIDLVSGLNSEDMPHMTMKQIMINSADQLYILADASKFNREGLFTVCPVSKVFRFITEDNISDELKEQIQTMHLPVDYVQV